MPDMPFGLLLVEGGDELALCEAVAGPEVWQDLVCWKGDGRDALPRLATLARLDPHFARARSVGLVLDMEEDMEAARAMAEQTLKVFGGTGAPVHGVMSGSAPRLGAFLAPDGQRLGSIEHLCRQAVRSPELARCVDELVACARTAHANTAHADKAWLNAYLSMLPDPRRRFHQAIAPLKGGIDPAHTAFEPLRSFLRSL
jgi:hypothetical protein